MNKKKVVIIDYSLGNLFSVQQACDYIGINAIISNDKEVVKSADALIIPGVGAFNEAMKNLSNFNLIDPIKENVEKGKPIFGICLGLQLLFTKSEEFDSGNGLDIIPGYIKKFSGFNHGKKVTVPQIAWNKISKKTIPWKKTPLNDICENDFMYFVHSYFVIPTSNDCILTQTNYGGISYCSSILRNNVFATQFHPEKSAIKGLSIYRNWAIQNNLI